MEDQLISFETAKLAKEKGFNIAVAEMYGEDKILYFTHPCESYYGISELENKDQDYFSLPIEVNIDSNKKLNLLYYATTQSLLQKWLRGLNGVFNTIVFCTPKLTPNNEVVWYNNYDSTKANRSWVGCYKTYEEALEVGLQKALKLL
jgi:hypothetical protein